MPPLANPLGGGPSDMITKSATMPAMNQMNQMNQNVMPSMNQMNQMNFSSTSNLRLNANYTSSSNLSVVSTPQSVASAPAGPPISTAQYAAWQRQFQSNNGMNNGVAFSATNLQQFNAQQQRNAQMQAMYHQQQVQNQRLFNQQRRMNGWGTTGQMSPNLGSVAS